MGKDKNVAFAVAMALAYSTATASTLCEVDASGIDRVASSTLVAYGNGADAAMEDGDDYDFYHFDAPLIPEETTEMEVTILEEREGELDVPDYLFDEIEAFD